MEIAKSSIQHSARPIHTESQSIQSILITVEKSRENYLSNKLESHQV